ncbi:ADP-ribosylglycohydrolase family protein [bacterium]|nr:MAG: ADP-ribosylglycohydrolase family protein [bacterium]
MEVLSDEYAERVYAGVLGKIVGVYLGRPFEGWHYNALTEKFGEVDRYVHEDLNVPLVVTDDDISGTFTFLRALEDHGFDPEIDAKRIGETWLNYLIEGRTVLWWGGNGVSTEHTAYLRLKHGVSAPESGSIGLNGPIVAEQIGSQIFIDGWGLIHPGEPERAVAMAEQAARVSHDGAAVDGAKVVAALVSEAFVEKDIDHLLDKALTFIPSEGIIAQLIADVRAWHAEGLDWRAGYGKIAEKYGYDKFGGGCHMVPNHALIIHALLHGGGDMDRSLMVVNTCGWDTDCNSANVGCILGVRNGLAGFVGYDWRGPVRDRLWLPTADGGRCVSDTVIETRHIVNAARKIRGLEGYAPKNGARFTFAYPGSVQGFDGGTNVEGSLRIEAGTSALTPTGVVPEDRKMGGYGLDASPTLYAGQTVVAVVRAESEAVINLEAQVNAAEGTLETVLGAKVSLAGGEARKIEWRIPVGTKSVARIGLRAEGGAVRLQSLSWHGAPEGQFGHDAGWTDALDNRLQTWGNMIHAFQNEGTGLAILGTREWTDLSVEAELHTNMAARYGLALRVQGLRRYVALVSDDDGYVRLVAHVENQESILAEAPFAQKRGENVPFRLRVQGDRFEGNVGETALAGQFADLEGGGVGLLTSEGKLYTSGVTLA